MNDHSLFRLKFLKCLEEGVLGNFRLAVFPKELIEKMNLDLPQTSTGNLCTLRIFISWWTSYLYKNCEQIGDSFVPNDFMIHCFPHQKDLFYQLEPLHSAPIHSTASQKIDSNSQKDVIPKLKNIPTSARFIPSPLISPKTTLSDKKALFPLSYLRLLFFAVGDFSSRPIYQPKPNDTNKVQRKRRSGSSTEIPRISELKNKRRTGSLILAPVIKSSEPKNLSTNEIYSHGHVKVTLDDIDSFRERYLQIRQGLPDDVKVEFEKEDNALFQIY